MSVAVGPAPVLEDMGASGESLRAAPAVVLEENRELRRVAAELREDNAELRERDAQREQELDRVRADLAVLQRLLFGRSSERSRPEPGGAGAGDDAGDVAGEGAGSDRGSGDQGGDGKPRRGPGARAGRRDYSHLPRFEMFWVVVHCRRRYRRTCGCRVPATVMAPGPTKAIGKGRFSNAFIAMLLTERFVAGRSQNSLLTGLARQGAQISPATLAGTCAQAGGLLAPVAEAITARSKGSWHLHADETTWRVFFAELVKSSALTRFS